MYATAQRSPALLGRLGRLRPRRRLRGLGDSSAPGGVFSGGMYPAIDPSTYSLNPWSSVPDSEWNFGAVGQWFSSLFGSNPAGSTFLPGGGAAGVLYNAATGDVSPSQKALLVQQATQAQIQAGMDPADAAAIAESSATTALNTFNGPGAFDVSWGGANPGQTVLSPYNPTDTPSWLATYWPWLAGGALLAFLAWDRR